MIDCILYFYKTWNIIRDEIVTILFEMYKAGQIFER